MTEERAFGRRFESLEAIFEFTSAFFSREGIDPRLLASVDFAVEELFTNMVKYGGAADPAAPVRIGMAAVEGGVEVTLTDRGVPRFDVTQAPDADVNLPIEERRPGGLGIHLIRRLVDSWDYTYSEAERESRIRFRKTLGGMPAADAAPRTGGA
jgi:serine/threonine-protein kinase RsbW